MLVELVDNRHNCWEHQNIIDIKQTVYQYSKSCVSKTRRCKITYSLVSSMSKVETLK